MKISIITISYNQVNYIEECILSVLSQTYQDIEYILLDSKSTDGSSAIIEKYRGQIEHVIVEKDKGPANALNKGLSLASGDLVGFVNSDDYLLPGTISELVKIVLANPEFDVYYGQGYIADERNDTYHRVYPSLWSIGCYRAGLSVMFQQSVFIRRKWLDNNIQFNEGNSTQWDGELLVDLDLAGARFYRHALPIGVFRIYPGTISDNVQQSVFRDKFQRDMRISVKKIDTQYPALSKSKVYWYLWLLVNDFGSLWNKAKIKIVRGLRKFNRSERKGGK